MLMRSRREGVTVRRARLEDDDGCGSADAILGDFMAGRADSDRIESSPLAGSRLTGDVFPLPPNPVLTCAPAAFVLVLPFNRLLAGPRA